MDGSGGKNVAFVEKSKERLRKLSVIHTKSSSNENCEMGSGGSNGGDKLLPTISISKRSKLPRKKQFFDDCNTVDHASVPRKLRSAMKKRNQQSISPPSSETKKRNHVIDGVELPRKDARKKCKKSIQQRRDLDRSLSRTSEGPITKDEEEVVETLSALAVMFCFRVNNKKNDFDCELVSTKSVPLPDKDNPSPALAARENEEDSNSHCHSNSADAANPSFLEGPALETVQIKCSAEYHSEFDSTICQRNLRPVSLLSNIDGKPSCSSVGCKVQPDLNMGSGYKHPNREESTIYAGKPAAAVTSKQELQYIHEERKNSGSALWPGLFSAGSHGPVTQGPSVQSSTAKTRGILHTVSSLARPVSLDNGISTNKDSIAPVGGKKTWKRCSAHLYICRLIEVLEIDERKDGSFFQLTQGSKQGGVLLAANNLNGVQSVAVSSHSINAEKNPNEITNAILLHKRLLQDQQQGPPPKLCADFLSLSAGDGGLEATNSTNKTGNVLEPLTQFHIPYQHSSIAQNHKVLPFSMPQIRFCSAPFSDNPPSAAAKQVQIPPPSHLGTPFPGLPNLSFSASPRQEQQQQRIWTTQCRLPPMGVAATHFPHWHNGRRHDPYGLHYAQFILPPSHPSLEVLGPKYSPISQHQLL